VKVIVAVIHPDAMGAVQAALDEPGARVVSVAVAGEPGASGMYRGAAFDALWPRFRVEIVVPNDAAAPSVLEAVVRAATLGGQPSVSGSVMMMDLDACVRIPSTGVGLAPSPTRRAALVRAAVDRTA
jgi:nitrogen regulatory protein PII